MKSKDILGTGAVILGALFLYEVLDEMDIIDRLKRSVVGALR